MRILAFPAFANRHSNPYNALLYNAVGKCGVEVTEYSFIKGLTKSHDIFHIHWPEWYLNNTNGTKAFINSCCLLMVLFKFKLAGKKIVWTIHNLKPHRIHHPYLNKIYWKLFKKLVDGTISLSISNQKKMLVEFPELENCLHGVTYHGLYCSSYPNTVKKNEARAFFGLQNSQSVYLFIGQLKPYKNIESLIKLFIESDVLQKSTLLIAGRFDSLEYEKIIESEIENKKNIKLFKGFVADDQLQYFFNASSVVILPFENIFNSGSALLSASFNTPVLVPYSDNFNEYGQLIPGLILTYTGELNANLITNHALTEKTSYPMQNKSLQWDSIAEETTKFYRSLIINEQAC